MLIVGGRGATSAMMYYTAVDIILVGYDVTLP